MKKTILALSLGTALGGFGDAVPVVTDATMAQPAGGREVTITYTLSDAPAVITLDVQTNATVNGETVWASIGGENVQHVTGDVWKQVETGSHTIKWQPDLSWPNHKIAAGGARAVVTAWSLDNTPDYMVVDISTAAEPNTQKYYPAAEFLPGGLLGNDDYRTSSLVMRKIPAKGVTWTMGSNMLETQRKKEDVRENTHKVTLTNNYYIGVFPVTQAQWALVQTSYPTPSYFNNADDRAKRPVEQVSYNEIRTAANSTTADAAYLWPADPKPGSFLGILRDRTGLDFDLPSEAQWEFACRAGNGSPKWGDGSGILNTSTDANLARLGRYRYNDGYVKSGTSYSEPAQGCGATNGTAIVGSYAPNDWGIYDMHGNVYEWCLDWYAHDISAYDGAVNIDPSNPTLTLAGATSSNRLIRGGSWQYEAPNARSAHRNVGGPTGRAKDIGFRVTCCAGLR